MASSALICKSAVVPLFRRNEHTKFSFVAAPLGPDISICCTCVGTVLQLNDTSMIFDDSVLGVADNWRFTI